MLAAGVGIVGDDEIAFAPFAERDVITQNVVEATRHGVQMHGNARRLRDAFAFGIEYASRIVEQVSHDARSARAPDGDAHFLGSGDEGIADDFELDDVERLHGHAAPPARLVAIRSPLGVVTSSQSGGMKWVACASSMIAGPAIFMSAASFVRS